MAFSLWSIPAQHVINMARICWREDIQCARIGRGGRGWDGTRWKRVGRDRLKVNGMRKGWKLSVTVQAETGRDECVTFEHNTF